MEVKDGRLFVGKFYCLDHKMSIILYECEEFISTDVGGGQREDVRRYIGLALILQEHIHKISKLNVEEE